MPESGRTKIAHGETPCASDTKRPIPAEALEMLPQTHAHWIRLPSLSSV